MTLLQMSFYGTVLILVIAFLRILLVQRLPKRTFLILWGIALLRLLLPFSIPSAFSVYSWIEPSVAEQEQKFQVPETDGMPDEAKEQFFFPESGGERYVPEMDEGQERLSLWWTLWMAGTIGCMLFFGGIWLRCRWNVKTSIPVENSYVRRWMTDHPLRRPVRVRRSGISISPFTCGIFRPVILLPRNMDWEKEEQIHYILLHEYIHICHLDAVWKLCLAAALCVHWFNPAVWFMYLLCNRDMELACDEEVIRRSGERFRSAYARTLISMEEQKSGMVSLCSYFSKNAAEERITAIMKTKKRTLPILLLATALIAGTAVLFATSAKPKVSGEEMLREESDDSGVKTLREKLTQVPGADFTEEESQWLFSLWFDGYESLSVADYQEMMWSMRDTPEKIQLLERFSQAEFAYETEDTEEAEALEAFLDYFYHIYEPLTAEHWSAREFSVWALAGAEGSADKAEFEGQFRMVILDRESLTVGEYSRAYAGVDAEMRGILEEKDPEMLMDEEQMQAYFQEELQHITEQWSSDSLKVQMGDWKYNPLVNGGAEHQEKETDAEGTEAREYPPGTREDYASLLQLQTSGYQEMSLEDFNMRLLDWANENHGRMERIMADTAWNDRQISLTEEEKDFVEITFCLSNMENVKMVQSISGKKPEEAPVLGERMPDRLAEEDGRAAWCSMYYQFSYQIQDKESVTVKERDLCVGGMLGAVRQFWEKVELEELLKMTEEDIWEKLAQLAEVHSSKAVKIQIQEDGVGFERMDERENSRPES